MIRRRWYWFLGREGEAIRDGYVQYGLGLATLQWTETIGWSFRLNRD